MISNDLLSWCFAQAMADELLETHVFVVKVWNEARDVPDASVIWRGSVENVATGGIKYFQSIAELASYLAEQTAGFGAES